MRGPRIILLVAVFLVLGPSGAPSQNSGKDSSAASPTPTFSAGGRVIAATITRAGWKFEPVAEVVMTFTVQKCCGGVAPALVRTNSQGRWVASFPLAGQNGGLYAVTAQKAGYTFNPKSIEFTEAHPWLEELNFQAAAR